MPEGEEPVRCGTSTENRCAEPCASGNPTADRNVGHRCVHERRMKRHRIAKEGQG